MAYALKNPTGAPSTKAFDWMVTLIRKAYAGNPAACKEALVSAAGYNAQQVSNKIDTLKMVLAKKPSSASDTGAVEVTTPAEWVPGKYLVDGVVYVLKIGKGSGAAYLLTEDGGYLGAKKGQAPAVLAAIAAEGQALAIAYGQKTGLCGICSTTLTNPDSIAKGIGPVCAEKF